MDIAAIKARDLTPAVKEWMQSLLGKSIDESDEVSLIVRSTTRQTSAEREAARVRLFDRIAAVHRSTEKVPATELDAAVDEAMSSIRPSYSPNR